MRCKEYFAVMLTALTLLTGTTVYADGVPEEEPESTAQPMPPLTPIGNGELADDMESPDGKQFITVTTKEGNYYYIIIDRDDDGKENVHFLSQVDEHELAAFIETEEETPVCTCPEIPADTQPEKEEDKPGNLLLPLMELAGLGIFLWMKFKPKKHPEEEYVEDFYEEEDMDSGLFDQTEPEKGDEWNE